MSIVVIIAALVLLMILTLKKVPVPIAVLISVVVIAVFTGSDVLKTISESYMPQAASFIQSNWLLLLSGTILSKVMDMTGAASSIAKVIVRKLGTKRVIPAIIFSGALLAYGGINGMALCFALYPIALTMFRQAGIPRYLIPAVLTSSLFTWIHIVPGAPIITNAIASQSLGTNGMAAPLIGIVCAVIAVSLELVYFSYALKKAEKKGDIFVTDEETEVILARCDEMEQNGTLPNPLIAVLPLLAVVLAFNVLDFELWIAMLIGAILCLMLLFKNIKGIIQLAAGATNEAAIITLTAGTVVGIGGVISAVPGFNDMIQTIVNFGQSGGNSLMLFSSATVGLSGLLTNGMAGLMTVLDTLSQTFLDLGVAPELLHRIGIIASAVLDCMPYSGGIVAIFAMTHISYKEGYKHVAITAVVPMFIALVVAIIMGSFLY